MKARNWTYSLALLTLLGTTASALPIAGAGASGQQAQASAAGASTAVRSVPKPSASRGKHEVYYAVYARAGSSSEAVMVQTGSLADVDITHVSLPMGDKLMDKAHGVTFFFVVYGAGSGSAQQARQSQSGLADAASGAIILVARDREIEPGQSFPDPLEPGNSSRGSNQSQRSVPGGLGITNFSQRRGGNSAQATVPAGAGIALIENAGGPRTTQRRLPEEIQLTQFSLQRQSQSQYQAGQAGSNGTIILVARDQPLEPGTSFADPLEPTLPDSGLRIQGQRQVSSGLALTQFSQRRGSNSAQATVSGGASSK